MENKTRKKRVGIVLAIFLIMNVSNMLRSDTLADIRAVDIVQLIACGMLIGAIIVNFVIGSKDNKE